LRMLLNQASAGRDTLRLEIEAALASAASLIQAGKQDEAVEFLKQRPQPVQRSVRVQTSLAALEEERTQALFRTLGRAYAGLDTDLSACDAAIRRAVTASAQSPIFVPVAEAFRARERALADRSIGEATRNAKSLLRERNREAAEQALQTVSGIVEFASSEVRSEWQDTRRNAAQTGLIARLRG